jgi:hypothetical protein
METCYNRATIKENRYYKGIFSYYNDITILYHSTTNKIISTLPFIATLSAGDEPRFSMVHVIDLRD